MFSHERAIIMKISVAMCTYRGEKYLRQQLDSILNQTRKPDEIVISDDGSDDKTLQIAKSCRRKSNDITIKILTDNADHGVVGNFTHAIRHCTGDIIFTCDQDDVWKKEKVERFLEIFESDPSAACVFSDAELTDGSLQPLGKRLWESSLFNGAENGIFERVLKGNIVTGACMAFRADMLDWAFPVGQGCLHDEWIGFAAACRQDCRLVPIPETLTLYRQHEQNVVGAAGVSFLNRLKQYLLSAEAVRKIRTERQAYYRSAYHAFSAHMSYENKKKLRASVRFWSESLQIGQQSAGKSILWILRNLLNQNYGRYYFGLRSALRDLASCRKTQEGFE